MINRLINSVTLFFVALLVFILPVGHTIAVRNIAIFYLLIISLYLLKKYKIEFNKIIRNDEIYNIAKILFTISLWMIIVALFVSDEPLWSLKEIKSEWLMPLLYFFTFIFLSFYFYNQGDMYKNFFYLSIILPLLLHVLYVDYVGIKYYIDTGNILSRFGGLTQGSDKSNYITNILLAFIIAEIIYRFRYSQKIININNFLLILFLLLTLLSSLFEGMRNGVVAIVFLSLSAVFFSFYNNKKLSKTLKYVYSALIVFIITIPTIYNFKNDSRWNSLIKTIPIAIETNKYDTWINIDKKELPFLSDNIKVNGSNYLRIAWGYEGLKLIYENPLGVGYGRNAFGHAIKEKYNLSEEETNIGHSHSGFIDLAVGIGIPGIVLWLFFGIYLVFLSYGFFYKYQSFFALVLFFNTTGFFSRFLVDSNMRDHMFQTFMLIIGFSIIFMIYEKLKYEKTLSNKSK